MNSQYRPSLTSQVTRLIAERNARLEVEALEIVEESK
jgi:hypothetical protein